MKTIPLRTLPKIDTKTIIIAAARTPEQGKAINYAEMGKRVRIIEAVEKLNGEQTELQLEDADHELLVKLLRNYPFQIADPELYAMVKEIIQVT